MTGSSVETVVEKHFLPRNGNVQAFTVGRNVVLHSADEDVFERDRDSVHANSLVLCEYKWDPKTTYEGRILSARDKLVAYRIFNELSGEAIRVLERETRTRHLIKDFRFSIVDLQFAQHAPLLAVLDKNANLYIYHVKEDGKELTKYLNVIRRPRSGEHGNPRVVWCPFMEDETKNTHIIAIYQGNTVDIFYLHTIKSHFDLMEVQLEQLGECNDAHVQIEAPAEISAVRISPDATACAVTTVEGEFIFYIIENFKSGVAHSIHPLQNLYVNEILFLDNLQRQDPGAEGPYWKYVVLASDNGRRLGIYSCYNWECVAKLRFESAVQASRLEVSIDPSARYIYLADYEGSNLFCVELTPAYPGIQPFFVACAQICFSQQLICVSPCSVEEVGAETDDLLLEDDPISPSKVNVTFAAITNRSLLELKVDVEKALDVDLNEDPEKGFKIVQEKIAQQGKQLMLSSQRLNSSSSGVNDLEISPRASAKKDSNSTRHGLGDSGSPRAPRDEGHSSALSEANAQELKKTRQLLQTLTEKNALVEQSLTEMNIQLEKLHKDNADLRREQTDNLADVLEKISNEIRARDEHIEQTVKRMNTDLRGDVKRIVEQTLNDNAVSLQSTMEVSNTRVVETVKGVLGQVIVPAIEQICAQLFCQLNDRFSEGLQEFVEQLKQNQSHAVTPLIPDYTTISQMLEQKRVAQALEFVLSRNDYAGLLYVCNKVNPESLFNELQPPLSPNILLSLLQILGQRFEQDTELKFNYLENIVMALSGASVAHVEVFRATLDAISKGLQSFISLEQNLAFKRQGRIINQLIISAMK